MKVIRVGIIGQGRSGWGIHGEYLLTDPRYHVVAAADPLADRRAFAQKTYGGDVYAPYRKLLERDDLDLVINASMSHQHPSITVAALEAGHNVLCEKPLARYVKDVDACIAAAKKSKKVLAIYQQARYAPYFQQIQKVIRSGVLGRVVQISIRFNGHSRRWDWQTLKRFWGGNLLNTGPHPLDQAVVLFGDGMPKVSCWMDRTEEGSFGNAENHVKLILSGKGHPLIDLEVSSCSAYPLFTYQVYGSRGGLTATTSEAQWKYFKPREAPKQSLHKEPLRNEQGDPIYTTEKLTWHTGEWSLEKTPEKGAAYSSAAAPKQGGMTEKFYSMLYKTLTRGTPLEITPEQIRRQVAVIEEAHRQNRSL